MKRTRAITLTMLAGTVLLLGGCLDDDQPKQMADEADCVEKTGDAEACRAAAEQAKKEFEQTAPKFSGLAECEAQFGPGRCNTVTREGGGSSVMPVMTGFLLGQMLANNGQRVYTSQPSYGSSWTQSKVAAARPVSGPSGLPAVVRGGFGRSAVGVSA